MWAIRILNGQSAGHIYQLKPGKNRIGRSADCDIQINEPGISKEHATIDVLSDKVFITDLKSSNGTFLNGVKLQNGLIKPGDKFSMHNILFDFVAVEVKRAPAAQTQYQMVPTQNVSHFSRQNSTDQDFSNEGQYSQNEQEHQEDPNPLADLQRMDLNSRLSRFVDLSLMPAIYRLIEIFEFRFVIFAFGGVFILLVTVLSMIPMNQITSESILIESRRRAITVARSMAVANEKMLRTNEVSSYSTDLVVKEEGITDVYIISKDGQIIAPAERVGDNPKETGFIQKLKSVNQEFSAELNKNEIAAAVPILSYDSQLQQNMAKAYVVVIYNMGSLSFDDGRAFSLFIQTLSMALILGFILFFMLYKLVEYPLAHLHKTLNLAMQEGHDLAESKIKFPILHQLLVSINSLLNRSRTNAISEGGGVDINQLIGDYSNMVNMMGFPAILLDKNRQIVTANNVFAQLLGTSGVQLFGQAISSIPDQALQKNIIDLYKQATLQGLQSFNDRIEISGHNFIVSCQGFYAGDVTPTLFVVTISPEENAQGGAA